MTHQNYNYFFIDECGYSLNTTRRVARSEKGQKAVVLEARNKGRNTSVVACVNKDLSLVPYEYKDGSINTNDFISFLNVMLSTVYDLNILISQALIAKLMLTNGATKQDGIIFSFPLFPNAKHHRIIINNYLIK